jgi:hypothetical protein
MRAVIVASFVLLSIQLAGQTAVGVLGGLNRSHEQYDVELPDDARTHVYGYHASAYLETALLNRLRLAVEAGYIQRGAACEPGFIIFNQDTELRLNYGRLAPSLLLDVLRLGEFSAQIYAGGEGSYLFSGNRTITNMVDGSKFERSLDLQDENSNMNRFDYGYNFGLMLRYGAGPGHVVARAGGYRGLAQIDRENFSLSRDWLASVGYLIQL